MRDPRKPAIDDKTMYGPDKRFAGAVMDGADPFTGEVEETRTKLEMQEACDINLIIEKYQKTRVPIDHVTLTPPRYGDFANSIAYQTALNAVHEANDAFAKLPPKVRTRFANDPSLLIDFINDPDNLKEGTELGLFEPPEELTDTEKPAETAPPTGAETPTDP